MKLIQKNWNKDTYHTFKEYLFTLQDTNYQKFHQKLIGTNNKLIGIRTPLLKKIAKEITKGNYQEFLEQNSKEYYEEILIYGLIITNIKQLNQELQNYINSYINNIDNWATCDLFVSNLKIVKNHKEHFYKEINKNIKSTNPWQKRYSFVLLTSYYIEEPYLTQIFKLTNQYNTNDYYVNMAVAWLISICYIKFPTITLKYLQKKQLDTFTHNKSIQKIIESTRISKEEKEQLKKLKIKT